MLFMIAPYHYAATMFRLAGAGLRFQRQMVEAVYGVETPAKTPKTATADKKPAKRRTRKLAKPPLTPETARRPSAEEDLDNLPV